MEYAVQKRRRGGVFLEVVVEKRGEEREDECERYLTPRDLAGISFEEKGEDIPDQGVTR